MAFFNPNKFLPPEQRVESVGDILFENGLCPKSNRDPHKRLIIDHPLFIITILLINVLQILIALWLGDKDEYYLIVYGDVGHWFGQKYYIAIFRMIATVLLLSTIFLHYYNHINRIEPKYMKVFKMISGSSTPRSIGIINEAQILTLVRRADKWNQIIYYNNNYIIPIIIITFELGMLIFHGYYFELVYGFINATLNILWARSFFNIIGYHFMIIDINSLYLKFKINALNEKLLIIKTKKKFDIIRQTIKTLNLLYSEINEQNEILWSKFLALFVYNFGANIILALYLTFFVGDSLIIKLYFVHALIMYSGPFSFILYSASSLNSSIHKSYKILNSLYISYSQQNISKKRRRKNQWVLRKLFNKFKVNLKNDSHYLMVISIYISRSFLLLRGWHPRKLD